MNTNQTVIVGAGPAGISTAIQLERYGLPYVLLEKKRVGGLLWNANLVENYPGFPAGINGPGLIRLFKKQMERIGVQVRFETVLALSHQREAFKIETTQNTFSAGFAVIASGTKPKAIPVEIPEGAEDSILSEVYPLLNEREKEIVIIGAGDAAFDYGLNLIKNRNSVTILNRGSDVKCLRLLWERAMAEKAIKYRDNIQIVAIEVEKATTRILIRLETGQSLKADHLLFAIGRIPQLDFLSDSVRKKESDLITKGSLYFAGDVQNGLLRQTAISAGDGLRTAMQIYQRIQEGSK